MYKTETISELNFELTSFCNARCPQCPRHDIFGNIQKDLKLAHLPLDTIKKLPIGKMKNLKNINFIGCFGDPLMHPQLDEIIEFFHRQKIHISTNASLRNVEWWNDLGKNTAIDSVVFCIDGLADTHEIYRRKTSYEKVMANAQSFIQAGGKATWQFIVFKHNEHQIQEAKKLSKDLGFAKIDFMYSDRFDVDNKFAVYENNEHLYDLEKSKDQVLLRDKLGAEPGDKYWKKMNENKGEISCVWSLAKKLYIHSDGLVYPCCMLGGISAGKEIEKLMYKKIVKDSDMIDLNKNDFEQIIGSEIFVKSLPNSFKGDPFHHPVCIEWCNKTTGKYANANLSIVNS